MQNAEFNGMMDSYKDLQIEIQWLIEKTFLASRAIDQESLCVSNGKLVWQITVEITAQAYDGNLIDSCLFAALLSLSTTKIPQVRVVGDTQINILHDKPWKPINVHHIPFPITFHQFEGQFILDPNLKEEWVCEAR